MKYRLKEEYWKTYLDGFGNARSNVFIALTKDCSDRDRRPEAQMTHAEFYNKYKDLTFEFVENKDYDCMVLTFDICDKPVFVNCVKKCVEKVPLDYVKILKENVL